MIQKLDITSVSFDLNDTEVGHNQSPRHTLSSDKIIGLFCRILSLL